MNRRRETLQLGAVPECSPTLDSFAFFIIVHPLSVLDLAGSERVDP
jgi:hypothetical protein